MGELSGVPEWALYSFLADDSIEVGLSSLIEWDEGSGDFNIGKEVVVYWPERPKKVSRRNSKFSAIVLLFHEDKKFLRNLADELARGEITEEDVIKLTQANNSSPASNLKEDNPNCNEAAAINKISRRRTPSSKVLENNQQREVKGQPGKQNVVKKSSKTRVKENQKMANEDLLEKIRKAEMSEWETSIQLDSVIPDVRESDKSDTSPSPTNPRKRWSFSPIGKAAPEPDQKELSGPSRIASATGVQPTETVPRNEQPGPSQSGVRPTEGGKETPKLQPSLIPHSALETVARPKEDRAIKRRVLPIEAEDLFHKDDSKDEEIASLRKKIKYYEAKIQWYKDISEMKSLVNEIRYLKSTVASLNGQSPSNSNQRRESFTLHTNAPSVANNGREVGAGDNEQAAPPSDNNNEAVGAGDNDQAVAPGDNDRAAGAGDNDQAAAPSDNDQAVGAVDNNDQGAGDNGGGFMDAHNEGVNEEVPQAAQNVVGNKFPISDEIVRRFSPALKMTLFVCKLMEYLYTTKFMSEHTLTTRTGNNGGKKEPLNPAEVDEIIRVTRGRFPVTERDPGLRQLAIIKFENDVRQTIRVKLNNEAGKAKKST